MSSSSLRYVAPNLYRSGTGVYYLLVKRSGRQIRRSLRTSDPALAKRRLREFQDKAALLTTGSEDRSLKFEELAARWLSSRQPELKTSSFRRLEAAVKGLSPYFVGCLVRSVNQRQIEAWKVQRGSGLSARTWNYETEVMRQIFDYAKDHLRVLISNPVEGVKRRKLPHIKIVVPTKGQFRQLVEELRDGHRASGAAADFVEFLGYSGCRKQEGSAVLWRDCDFNGRKLIITGGEIGTKNHEQRTIPLFAPLERLLVSLKEKSMTIHSGGSIFSIKSAGMQIKRACGRLGLPIFGHHTMRHFFCSNAIEAGIDFKTIAEWLGHKDGGVLVARTYGHLRHEHNNAMAVRMNFDASE